MCPSASTIPRYLSSTSVKPKIICHVCWHFLWLASCRIFASLVRVPGPASQLPTSVSLLSQTPVCQWALCPDGAPKALPPWESDPWSPVASKFCLLTPSPFSEQSWVLDFVFYEVWLFLASFLIMPLSFKSIFLRIYELVYRACLWSKLCGFYIHVIRG